MSLSLADIPSIFIIIKGLPRHLQVLLGVEHLPDLFTTTTGMYGQIVAFSCNLIKVTLTKTIKVEPTWW